MTKPYWQRRDILENLRLAGSHWCSAPSFEDAAALSRERPLNRSARAKPEPRPRAQAVSAGGKGQVSLTPTGRTPCPDYVLKAGSGDPPPFAAFPDWLGPRVSKHTAADVAQNCRQGCPARILRGKRARGSESRLSRDHPAPGLAETSKSRRGAATPRPSGGSGWAVRWRSRRAWVGFGSQRLTRYRGGAATTMLTRPSRARSACGFGA